MTSVQKQNTYHLIMDIGWFGFALATTSRFLSIYAIRLDATPMQVAWLTALPAVVLLFTSILGGWWRARYQDSLRALYWPALGFRFSYLLLAMTPAFPITFQPYWLIIAVTLPAIPQGIAGVVFLVMMREALETPRVPLVVGWRMIALNVGLALGAVLCGLWLERAPFPLNYQMMFLVAFAATLISWWHCNRIHLQLNFPLPKPGALREVWASRRLWSVAWLVMASYVTFFALVPLVPFFLVRERGAAEGFIAAFGLLELGGGAMMAVFAGRLMNRFGDRAVAGWAMAFTALPTVMIALLDTHSLILVAAFLLGGTWTVVTVALFSVFNNAGPDEQATEYATVYNQVIGLATFAGPLLGSALAEGGVGLTELLLGGAVLRFGVGALIVSVQSLHIAPLFGLRRGAR